MSLTDAVPSAAFDVLERNCKDLDSLINGDVAVINRTGDTLTPIQTILLNLGYIDKGTFASGATLNVPNDILQSGGEFYRWTGAFPKVVGAGSSPDPAGVGGWLLVGDSTLRQELFNHENSPDPHPQLTQFIEDSLVEAQNAADIATVNAKIYPDTTAGLAATTEGSYFSVPSGLTNEYLILYRKVSGVANEIKRYPSTNGILAFEDARARVYTEPNLNPDVAMNNLSVYQNVTPSYASINGTKCIQIPSSYTVLSVPRASFSQSVMSASCVVQYAASGNNKRVLLMQRNSSGSEIAGTRQTFALSTGAITSPVRVAFDNISIDDACVNVWLYIDTNVSANMLVNQIFIGSGPLSGWRQEKPVLQSELSSVNASISTLNSTTASLNTRTTSLELAQAGKTTYFGNLVFLPSEFNGSGVSFDVDSSSGVAKLVYDESDPATLSGSKVTYYVDPYNPAASNSNAGTNPALPLLSLSGWIDKLSATPPATDVCVILGNGIYYRDRNLTGKSWIWNYNLSMIASTEAIITDAERPTSLTWAADGTSYVTTRTATFSVWDASKRDYRGMPVWLTKVASSALVKTTPNSWYTDGTQVWVRTFDSRAPDANLLVQLNLDSFIVAMNAGKTCYMKNLKWLQTGSTTNHSLRITTTIGDSGFFKGINCAYGGSYAGNGFWSNRTVVYNRDCTAAYNNRDGFNYHDNISSPQSTAIESGCHSYANGLSLSGTDNGSTAHEGMKVIRANCLHYNCYGPVVVDVNGCYSFNVNVKGALANRPAGITTANFYFDSQLGIKTGKAWLVGCSGYDSQYDISSDGSVDIFLRGWDGSPIIETTTATKTVRF